MATKNKEIEDGVYESPAAAVASVKEAEEEEHEQPIAEPSAVGPTPRQTMIAFQKACRLSGMDDEAFFDMIQDYFDTEGHPRTRPVRNMDLAGIPSYPEIKVAEVEGGWLFESAIRGSRVGMRFTGSEEDKERAWPGIKQAFKDTNDLTPPTLPEGVTEA